MNLSEMLFNRDERLLDYITNLQQEIEHLDKVNCHLRKKINNDIYKSRIEKAVEYIGEYKDYCDKEVCDCTPEYFEDLLNILNGRSDE